MIIGNGDIAKVLTDREDVTFFASGVSNSKESDEGEYFREIDLLMKQDKNRHIVYFSSLSIYYSLSRYSNHKLLMENQIRHHFKSYTIIRLGNITWGNNPHTLLNFLRNNPTAERRNEIRYLVDLDEFKHWVSMIRVGVNDTMNITGSMINVKDIK